MLIDTHAHLYLPDFDDDRNEVVARAKEQGVATILLPNIDSTTTDSLKKMVDDFPETCLPMMGLHPCSVKLSNYKEELDHVQKGLDSGGNIAVGEIGMDLYWDQSTKDIQEEAFVQQCRWAVEYNLPVAIHSRNATRELIKVLQVIKLNGLRGVFHCFGDGIEEARDIIDLGLYLGIGGVLTFKNSGLSAVLEQLDLSRIVLETDSPYLAPVPHRGKRNESVYVKLVAQRLSEVHDISVEQIADITTHNARELFVIP